MLPVVRAWTPKSPKYKNTGTVELGEVRSVLKTSSDDWVMVKNEEGVSEYVPTFCFDSSKLPEHVFEFDHVAEACGYVGGNVGQMFKEIYREGEYIYGFNDKLEIGWVNRSCLSQRRHRIDAFSEKYGLTNGCKYYLHHFMSNDEQNAFIQCDSPMRLLIQEFCDKNNLDEDACNKLKTIDSHLAGKVMDHGFFVRAYNPSAVVMSRIKMYRNKK
jgi:hypothetical protein